MAACLRDCSTRRSTTYWHNHINTTNSTARETQTYTHSGIEIRNPYQVPHRIIRELLLRDFVRFGRFEAGTSIFKSGGRDKVIRQNQEPRSNPQHLASWRWSSDRGLLQAWIDGRTGIPFINICMRELKMTGYCHWVAVWGIFYVLCRDLFINDVADIPARTQASTFAAYAPDGF